ncbi:SAM-dependent methyltransferase [Frankia sp. AgPm24]|uniref:SAM-dependent methyltransferase n=1 Tax=Frankia sp. AgPm24 TaxID=631128 RepID=UPI00200FD9A3|nr:SAM-dependent methyltransferase [Frankia sp. AgPm24]MCK9921208.1 SAM-dependent methyltransferase [Frankia sp. AgPm24]
MTTRQTVGGRDPAVFPPSASLDPSVAHPARMYDYFLGGKDHLPADRVAAEAVVAASPDVPLVAHANRYFMTRAARFLASECGIRQYLDVGTGFPTSPNLHEVVQAVDPASRVVYSDNDPVVLVHARALLTSTPEGRTAYLDADLRDPALILDAAQLRDALDFRQPIALFLVAVLHFLTDGDDAHARVRSLVDALPSGSYLVVSHATGDLAPSTVNTIVDTYATTAVPLVLRHLAAVTRFFDGTDVVDPGVVRLPLWKPDTPPADIHKVWLYGGVGRKS